MKAVFQTKISPGYDDVPEERYHFPKTYLRQVERSVGDWIIYYEPRRSTSDVRSRGGRQSYFAIAKVEGIRPDSLLADHYYADVSGYLPLDIAVPFKAGKFFYESALRGADGRTNMGPAQRAVRNLPDAEFELILTAGFAPELKQQMDLRAEPEDGLAEPIALFERPLIETTVTRLFRDRVFARQIQSAYDKRCAMTGLRILNGGGRPEAQAAHIRPVADKGPDSIRNGLSLSSTMHWMFDRGLISIEDDFHILTAKGSVPSNIEKLFNPTGYLIVPEDFRMQPHKLFLRYHREHIFKG